MFVIHSFQWFEGVRKCSEHDSLTTVIEVIVKAEVHRLIVTDESQTVVGIISLSDILKHIVLELPKTAQVSHPLKPSSSTEAVDDPMNASA